MKYLLVCVILITTFALFKESKWKKYYTHKLYHPPSPLVVKAASYSPSGIALDLGCGAGNETAYLLNKGWQVWAIDSQPLALKTLKSRKDLQPRHLTLLNSTFEKIDWKSLPSADLLCASCALPFVSPAEFRTVWNQIIASISPSGRFAGHFFGPHYVGFKEKMTYLTKEEVLALFSDFEIEHFAETEEDGESGTGEKIHSHIFEVIARKQKSPDIFQDR